MSRPSDYVGSSEFDSSKAVSPDIGIRGWGRWFWRQLTSMRVALILLLMLAVAAIPGSLFPQNGADPNGVAQYQQDHPQLFKILNAFPIQAFDVYASAWFSAIYLLLFVSLIGCVLPRVAHHWKALRGNPPKTPARLNRMAGYSHLQVSNPQASEDERLSFAQRAAEEAQVILKRQRYRTEVQHIVTRRGATEISVSAERGYLRETGNLVFHIALLGVLVAVAIGGAFTFNGQRVIVEGDAMINQLIDYDSVNSGRSFSDRALEPFELRLDHLGVTYVTPDDGNLDALGQVLDYKAEMTLVTPDGAESQEVIRVNHPLRVHGSPIYLIANGYAPTLVIRNAEGETVFNESVPFIPQDTNMTSLGILKVPYGLSHDGERTQLGLRGFFYPSQAELDTGAFTSNFPDLINPLLTLDVYVGNLGIDSIVPQSVYALDTTEMTQVAGRQLDTKSLQLRIGDTVDLPDGMGTITLEAIPRFASFDVMRNPAQEWVLVFAVLAIFGLAASLFVPRRRMWVKASPTADGVRLEYAGLARGDDPTLEAAVEALRDEHRSLL